MSAPDIHIKLLDFCNRGGLHCCIDAKPKGKTMSKDDLSCVLEAIGASPELPEGGLIGLTGGDVLQHPELSYALDLFYGRDLKVRMGTRGFTAEEKLAEALPYRNFRMIIERMRQGHPRLKCHLGLSLSFDVYGFAGDRERSLYALTSTLPELIENSPPDISLMVVSSPERRDETTELFMEGLRRRGSIGGRFTEPYWRGKWEKLNDIVFNNRHENPMGVFPIKKKGGGGIYIRLGGLDYGGRANQLKETHQTKTRCNILNGHEVAFVDTNLDVRLCCTAQAETVPPYSNLRDNPLAIHPAAPDRAYIKYVDALDAMQSEFDRRGCTESICGYCAKNLPRLLGRK